ncbi:MAG: hypothetical protein WD060_05775 [Pirellulales bacterium]
MTAGSTIVMTRPWATSVAKPPPLIGVTRIGVTTATVNRVRAAVGAGAGARGEAVHRMLRHHAAMRRLPTAHPAT